MPKFTAKAWTKIEYKRSDMVIERRSYKARTLMVHRLRRGINSSHCTVHGAQYALHGLLVSSSIITVRKRPNRCPRFRGAINKRKGASKKRKKSKKERTTKRIRDLQEFIALWTSVGGKSQKEIPKASAML